ncbi:MAG: fructokinase [Bacteroidetes bacterium]|nr:MAG: fructokinase [Bacteroidota bacterium]
MKQIFCIGETVFDIIFRDNQPVAARPGGSMLNTAVSLGRTGLKPVFISDLGLDAAGDLILASLESDGIDTRYVERFSDGQTAISLAFLDEKRNASYSFYRNFPETRLLRPLPQAETGDIVLFGSFYSISPEVRNPLWDFLTHAREHGAFLVYDPNFRTPYLKQLPNFRPWINENIAISQITRGSAGDFMHIFEVSDAAGAYEQVIAHGGKTLIYTKSDAGVEVITPDIHLSIPVPEICPVSTIGAGDAFNAGLIYSLAGRPAANPLPQSEPEWKSIILLAIDFSTDVCLHIDNYISPDFAENLKHG